MNRLFFLFTYLLVYITAYSQNCDMHVCVVAPDVEQCGGSQQVSDMLASRLIRALSSDGVTGDMDYGQFYVTGRFDDWYKETLPGPPKQTAVRTTLTLMMADFSGNKIYASESFDLRGVGSSEQRAYLSALKGISLSNAKFKDFIKKSQDKAIRYFDNNYEQLLLRAESAAARHDYAQALYYSTLIPECSIGYAKAAAATKQYFQKYADENGANLLLQAKAIFAQNPNADGVAAAMPILSQIPPSSSSYTAAMKFSEEMNKQAKTEYNFEVHDKYKDDIQLQKAQIDAAKQVGVAYGRGQKQETTNILWK